MSIHGDLSPLGDHFLKQVSCTVSSFGEKKNIWKLLSFFLDTLSGFLAPSVPTLLKNWGGLQPLGPPITPSLRI
jgi:hypothetical protein